MAANVSLHGVVWQVPGLRPPALGRQKASAAGTSYARPREPEARPQGSRVSPRALPLVWSPLWDGTSDLTCWPRQTIRTGIGPGGRQPDDSGTRPPFTFISPLGLVRPLTRTHVRLLGPCFKTGRVGHRPFARRERKECHPSSATRPSQGSQDTGGFPLRTAYRRELAVPTLGYQSDRAFDVPSNGSRRLKCREEIRPPAPARVKARPRDPGSPQRKPTPGQHVPTS